ncbi:hypothetical protein [Microbulbifer sp. THAF38]|uniref:hypothetical protein n=1 Tax=Microbulbifer sp. THAF38 TaxID=2587856 RepID=UPI0012685465|nr:hypothetical protein [Microbulbifer sp. THAF38]
MKSNKKFPTPKPLYLAILTAGFTMVQPNFSLAACTGDIYLRTCDLQGRHTVNYEAYKKEVDFTLRSNRNGHAQPFAIRVIPEIGRKFQLFSDTGEPLDISLSFSSRNSVPTPLRPDIFSKQYPGSLNDLSNFLSVNINPASAITSNFYYGNFQMEVMQYINSQSTESQTVNFDIEMEVEPSISIRNLRNIQITNASFSSGQDITGYEDFCIDGVGFSNYLVNLTSRNGITSGARGAKMFQLNGAMESLPYAASFTDDMNQTLGARTLSVEQARGTLPNRAPGRCLTDNARLFVTIPAGSWEHARGTYFSDVLTVTVTSQ